MVCFSTNDPNSYWSVKERWVPELRKYAPGVPFVVVGIKRPGTVSIELAERGHQSIATREGHGLARVAGAVHGAYDEYKGSDDIGPVVSILLRWC
jgi:Ras family protein Q